MVKEPSEIQMWKLQTQILSPLPELRSDSLRAQVEPQHSVIEERSFTMAPTSHLPLHKALLLSWAVLLSVSTGTEVAFSSHGYPAHPHGYEQSL